MNDIKSTWSFGTTHIAVWSTHSILFYYSTDKQFKNFWNMHFKPNLSCIYDTNQIIDFNLLFQVFFVVHLQILFYPPCYCFGVFFFFTVTELYFFLWKYALHNTLRTPIAFLFGGHSHLWSHSGGEKKPRLCCQ